MVLIYNSQEETHYCLFQEGSWGHCHVCYIESFTRQQISFVITCASEFDSSFGYFLASECTLESHSANHGLEVFVQSQFSRYFWMHTCSKNNFKKMISLTWFGRQSLAWSLFTSADRLHSLYHQHTLLCAFDWQATKLHRSCSGEWYVCDKWAAQSLFTFLKFLTPNAIAKHVLQLRLKQYFSMWKPPLTDSAGHVRTLFPNVGFSQTSIMHYKNKYPTCLERGALCWLV